MTLRIFIIALILIAAPLNFVLSASQSTYIIPKVHESAYRDKQLIKALKYASSEKWNDAIIVGKKSKTPQLSKRLTSLIKVYEAPEKIEPQATLKFFKANPWLPPKPFARQIEKSFTYLDDSEVLIKWFKYSPPNSNYGKLILHHAKIKSGRLSLNDKKTRKDLRKYWRTSILQRDAENYFIKQYGKYFALDDYLKKIEFLTWNNSISTAKRLVTRIPTKYRRLPVTRLKIAKRPYRYSQILRKTPASIKNDDFIQYTIAKYMTKKGWETKAYKKLAAAKPKSNYEKWWKLKSIAIRNAIDRKQYKQAYRLTKNHNLDYGVDLANAEWLAGWLAFRFLNEPKMALKHFKALFENTKFATSKSKASYWIARTYEKLRDREKAKYWYKVAIGYKGSFYGQLAITKLKKRKGYVYFAKGNNLVTEADLKKDREQAWNLVKTAHILHLSNNKILAKKLVKHVAKIDLGHKELQKLIKYLTKHKNYPLTVELAKITSNSDAPIIRDGYPKHIKIKNNKLPKGLYLAVIRQESHFDQGAVSPAGAKGLMQIMPRTASMLAKKLKLSRNAYARSANANVAKGVEYINQLYERYDSYILTIAAYNAGTSNVNKWIKKYGDPRKFKRHYEVLDWIESIPFGETRFYVKKVLENYVIYNSMLEPNHSSKTLLAFLMN